MDRPRFYGMVAAVAACALMALPAAAESQARIVRLSDVQGGVQIDKNSGLGFENAFLNLPVTQGTQLRTGDRGRAEIEFEDGSTMRITPNTTVVFRTLGNEAGKRKSAVDLESGQAYVNWLGKGDDEFTLSFSKEKLDVMQAAHFRVDRSAKSAEIASFKNEIEVIGPAGAVKVDKKKMVAFDIANNDAASTAKLAADPNDNWDKDSISYHDGYAKNNSSPLGYGVSDLNYYGSYNNVSGYGMLWQPYFAGAGWNPYMDGAWSFYPGMGYMWASAYPWGWLPYYYGNWVYAQGFGWGWQPGGFSGWHGGIHYVGAVAGFQAPVAPVGTAKTVIVGRGGATISKPAASTTLRSGTAGLGIARGSVDDMRWVNRQVAKSGSAQIPSRPQFSALPSGWNGYGYTAQTGANSGRGFGVPAVAGPPAGHASGVAVSGHK